MWTGFGRRGMNAGWITRGLELCEVIFQVGFLRRHSANTWSQHNIEGKAEVSRTAGRTASAERLGRWHWKGGQDPWEGSRFLAILPAVPLQEVVLIMLLPQAIHFATCRAGFVADCQLVLTTRSYSSLHAWRMWKRYQRWCLPKYKTKGVCLLCKEGLFHFNLNVLPMSVLSLKLFFACPPFPLVFQPALTSDLAPGLPEIWRSWEIPPWIFTSEGIHLELRFRL